MGTTYYWIGGGTAWDSASNWSSTGSGGPPGSTSYPGNGTTDDIAIFDTASGSDLPTYISSVTIATLDTSTVTDSTFISIWNANALPVTVTDSINMATGLSFFGTGTSALTTCQIDRLDNSATLVVVPLGGTVTRNFGTITTNNGTVTTNYSIVVSNHGTVPTNASSVTTNETDGVVTENDLTVTNNYGEVTTNGSAGTVTNNYGVVITNDGAVTGATGGTVVNQSGSSSSATANGCTFTGAVSGGTLTGCTFTGSSHIRSDDDGVTISGGLTWNSSGGVNDSTNHVQFSSNQTIYAYQWCLIDLRSNSGSYTDANVSIQPQTYDAVGYMPLITSVSNNPVALDLSAVRAADLHDQLTTDQGIVAGIDGNILTGTNAGALGNPVGTLTLPAANKVDTTNGAYGVGGTGSTPTLNLTGLVSSVIVHGTTINGVSGNQYVPAAGNVRSGTNTGATTGTCVVPAASDVRLGVAVDVSPGAGTLDAEGSTVPIRGNPRSPLR
jgi:hypothetical protein